MGEPVDEGAQAESPRSSGRIAALIVGGLLVVGIGVVSAALLIGVDFPFLGNQEGAGPEKPAQGESLADTTTSSLATSSSTSTTTTSLPITTTSSAVGGGPEFERFDLSGVSISVGSKDFVEQVILGHMLRLAFEYVGADVENQVGLGATADVRDALLSGEIDTYVEYNGTGYLLHLDVEGEAPSDPETLTRFVRARDLAENGIHWLSRAPFNNAYGFVSSPERTEENGGAFDMQSMADWLEENPEGVLCVESDFAGRPDGLALFEEGTGYDVPEGQIEVLDAGLIYSETAGDDAACDFGEVFTTDGRIRGLRITLVDDPGVMRLFNPSVTMRDDLYRLAPDLFDSVSDAILSGLTQETMTELNHQVIVAGDSPEDVARQYLVDEGLIGPSEQSVVSTTTTVPGDLELGVPMARPDCNGSFATFIGAAVNPASYDEEVSGYLNDYPGSRYLRTDVTCASLRQRTSDGEAIYAVFFGPYDTFEEACEARSLGPSGAYVKPLDNFSDPEELPSCE